MTFATVAMLVSWDSGVIFSQNPHRSFIEVSQISRRMGKTARPTFVLVGNQDKLSQCQARQRQAKARQAKPRQGKRKPHPHLLVCIDMQLYLLICLDVCIYLLILVDISLISIHIYAYLLILVQINWYSLIFANIY